MSGPPDLDGYSDDELIEERDFLLSSLADLDAERDAGDVGEDDYTVLRDGYTARAAAVLRVLDRRRVDGELADRAASPTATSATATIGPGNESRVRAVARRSVPTGRTRPPRWRTPAVIGGIAALAVVAGLGVASASGQRLPGDTGSGTVPNNKTQQLLALAVQDFQKGDVVNSLKTYDKVLASDPSNVEALTYKGWLLRLAGTSGHTSSLIDQGLASIQEAERIDPSYSDPHFFAGEIYLRDKNDPKDAITEFQTYLADNPPTDMGPEVQGELQAAQAALNGTPQPGERVTPLSPTTTSKP
jgi:tetratricopeptide (TPR) repeat protein